MVDCDARLVVGLLGTFEFEFEFDLEEVELEEVDLEAVELEAVRPRLSFESEAAKLPATISGGVDVAGAAPSPTVHGHEIALVTRVVPDWFATKATAPTAASTPSILIRFLEVASCMLCTSSSCSITGR
mmetsp:Transcript_4780/g.10300  ORF Transcript_4780/g.10300 Transcript_4780/m.10300 type:complete len:129 (+) Transcript_4780:93-479(+)